MINKESIISLFNDKPTLLEWLKKVEEALKNASAVSFKVNKRGDATLTFSIVFDDGSEIESDAITLQQGESVQSAAIRNGHLFLTLTNGDELDAGNMFNGDITLQGNFAAASVKTPSLTSDGDEIAAQKPVVEVMKSYYFIGPDAYSNFEIEVNYAGISKNANKLTCVIDVDITRTASGYQNQIYIGYFQLPQTIIGKLIPSKVGNYNFLENSIRNAFSSHDAAISCYCYIEKKTSTKKIAFAINTPNNFVVGTKYHFRYEVTFLLSGNLAA